MRFQRQIVEGSASKLTGFGLLSASNMSIMTHSDGTLKFYNDLLSTRLSFADVNGVPSILASSSYSPLFATASTMGVLRIYNAMKTEERNPPNLLYRGRLHSGNILTVSRVTQSPSLYHRF